MQHKLETVQYSHSTTKSLNSTTSEKFHTLFDIKSYTFLPFRSLNIMHKYYAYVQKYLSYNIQIAKKK